MEFITRPCTQQNEGTLKVDCHWLCDVSTARHWHTKSKELTTVDMVYVVATEVEMKPISPTNMPRNRTVRRQATQLHAMRITNESHDLIIDEISRREILEYDPSRFLIDNESDSDSDDDEEES